MKPKSEPEWSGELWAIGLLTVIAAIVRVYGLGVNALWLDEAATYTLSVVPLDQIWSNMATGEFNPPLFFVIEHFMLMIGNNEIALRFMPALFGIFTVPVIYLVGKEFRDKYVGLIAAAAFAVSPFLISYSQEARAYSLLLLLCAGMMLFFLKGLKSSDIKNWMAFAALAGVAVWTHFYAVVFIIALYSYAALTSRAYWTRVGQAGVVTTLLSLPILMAIVTLIGMRTKTAPTYGIQGIGIILETFRQISGYADILTLLMVSLLIIGLAWAFFNAYDKCAIIVWTLAISLGASLFLSFIIPMLPRYLIFLTIPFYLGVGLAYRPILNAVSYRTKPVYAVMWFTVFFCMMAIPFMGVYYEGTKDDWRGVAGYLGQVAEPGDIIIPVPNYIELPFTYYYHAEEQGTFVRGLSTADGLEVAKLSMPNSTFYYVVTPDVSAADPTGTTVMWLKQNAEFSASFKNGIVVLKGVKA